VVGRCECFKTELALSFAQFCEAQNQIEHPHSKFQKFLFLLFPTHSEINKRGFTIQSQVQSAIDIIAITYQYSSSFLLHTNLL
jgi:hypothetical protein